MIGSNELYVFAIIVAGVAIAAGGVGIHAIDNAIRASRPDQHYRIAVLKELDAYAHMAVLAGERLALSTFADADQKLATIDQAKQAQIASKMYDLLPATIAVAGRSVPIDELKTVVSRYEFTTLVENAFGRAHAFIQANEAYLTREIGALSATANTPK